FVVSDPDQVEDLFEENGIPHSVSEVVVTELKEGATDLAAVLAALLKAEVNVLFSYPLLVRPRGRAVLALHVDDNECASSVLRGDGFPILTQADLSR
ncbi:MAG: acetolactate synthase, partial [Chthoniobacterales bacterium]